MARNAVRAERADREWQPHPDGRLDSADDLAEFPTEADIDAVIEEFAGNAREAIRALLHDLTILAGDYQASVSHGFVRGDVPKLVMPRRG